MTAVHTVLPQLGSILSHKIILKNIEYTYTC